MSSATGPIGHLWRKAWIVRVEVKLTNRKVLTLLAEQEVDCFAAYRPSLVRRHGSCNPAGYSRRGQVANYLSVAVKGAMQGYHYPETHGLSDYNSPTRDMTP